MRNRQIAAEPQNRRIVAYIRVSTDDQAVNGISIDAQKARLSSYAAAMALGVSEIVVDAGESAKSLQRPGLQQILAGVRSREIGTVIVLKLDRLTRSTRDLAELLELFGKADAALVSVSESLDTSSAAGRMVVNMLGVVAQWEREAIGERTATALAHKRATGRVYGSVPFATIATGMLSCRPSTAKRRLKRCASSIARALHFGRSGATSREPAYRPRAAAHVGMRRVCAQC